MNGSRRRETSKEKAKSRAAWFGPEGSSPGIGSPVDSTGVRTPDRGARGALCTTGSFEEPNPKGCATQFKSLSHPPRDVDSQRVNCLPSEDPALTSRRPRPILQLR
jgi:hypothetical protein